MSRDATTAFARALVDEWVRHGVTDACLAPGSRSAPLALALADDDRIRLHVHLDERSASFFALGLARASGRPAVVLCTSGTAAANFHPAVLEAHHGRVPLIVCSADRPPELRDTGAGQTVDQVELFGGAVRWFHEAEVPSDRPGAGATWRALASRAVAAAIGPPAGPVHVNLPFREPLVPTGDPLVDAPGRADERPWTATAPGVRAPSVELLDALAHLVADRPRGLVVAGWGANVRPSTALRFAEVAGWPVLADPLSNLRVPGTVSSYDPLLRVPGFADAHRPDVVLRIGGPTTNKPLGQWLDPGLDQVLVDPDGAWLDPQHAASGRMVADPELLLGALADAVDVMVDEEWLRMWRDADASARRAIDGLVDSWDEPFEGRIARDVVRAAPAGTSVVVASSMPVRDVESFTAARDDVLFHANRGVNGIDGFVSTALGVAAASEGPTLALVGDLCFLHDSNGLLGAVDRGIDATFVVVDNNGGGIFSFLPQAQLPEHFDTIFGTPQPVDVAALAAVHGVRVTEVTAAAALEPALLAAVDAGGVQVVRVRTDRDANVDRHRDVWA
ncbi:MAG TPA: 2-succinyl-5-enolpyruvyl-6-hydroxy-3-cyclohexene-1-carboxylic-acid synthase, partial [Acidimicrobiia bacterium]|nr:2-succinyl-5-enolpyruvyl-6-hydroxy-3-cyclohexene-1-carboxylic-acid synthase [Acidimicrobiia bacterium]